MLCRLHAPSPVPAAPLLSGPGRSAEEDWQGYLQWRRLQSHGIATGLSRGGGDDQWGEMGKGEMRQPRVKDNLYLGRSINGLDAWGESCETKLERLGSPGPGVSS